MRSIDFRQKAWSAGLIVLFENGSHRLRAGGRLVRRSGEDNRGEHQREGGRFHEYSL